METSITKEQAQARRQHVGALNSAPFYTQSYKNRGAAQDEDIQNTPGVFPADPAEADQEEAAKELAVV